MIYVLTYSFDGIPKINTSKNYEEIEKFRKHLVAAANENVIDIDYIRLEKIEMLYEYAVNPLFHRVSKGMHYKIDDN